METGWKALSSIEGRIEDLLVTLPPSPNEYLNEYYEQIEEAFSDRPKVIRYRNYHPPRAHGNRYGRSLYPDQITERRLIRILEGREVISYNGDGQFFKEYAGELVDFLQKGLPIHNTGWAQDAFTILENMSRQTAFLQPLFSDRIVDKFISLQLAAWKELDMVVRPTKLLIEGGNLLAGSGFILAGKDMLARNILFRMEKDSQNREAAFFREQVENDFRRDLGVDQILWVGFERSRESWKGDGGESYQPDFHIDLFITLGGCNSEGKQIIFLGDPELARSLLKKEVNLDHYPIPDGALSQFHELKRYFEGLIANPRPGIPEIELVNLPLFIYQDIVMSFNNCLVESFDGQKKAYLPEYATSECEDRYERLNPVFKCLKPITEQLFRDAGFDAVTWIGPGRFFRKLALLRGSLHCITKVLRRSQS